ncbi:MAG: hypothetical protein AAGN66_09310 [Acidobacteriota bacterium]
MRIQRSLVLSVVLGLAATLSAGAASFTVTLSNGTSFDTRSRPVDAEWDDNMAMFLTDRGNWIAVAKDEIVDVVSDAEASGFGYQVNTTTIFLGFSPNDWADDGEGGEEGEGAGGGGGGQGQEEEIFYGDEPENDGFSLEQFIDIPAGGVLPGGISVGPVNPSGGSEGSDSGASDG